MSGILKYLMDNFICSLHQSGLSFKSFPHKKRTLCPQVTRYAAFELSRFWFFICSSDRFWNFLGSPCQKLPSASMTIFVSGKYSSTTNLSYISC